MLRYSLNYKKSTCQLNIFLVGEYLLIGSEGLIPPVLSFSLWVCFLDFLICVNEFDKFVMSDAFCWSKLNDWQDFIAHERYHEGMLAVKANILIWNYRVCHGTTNTCWQDRIIITEGLWTDSQASQFHFLCPLTVHNQMRKLVVASSCCLIPL